jgi:putative DNA primase/helicase
MQKQGPLARGSGFLARFLIAAPMSTQGERPYREPPATWPALDAYQARLRALLDMPLPWNNNGLAPPALKFKEEAKASWVAASDKVERELRHGGECRDVRDVASKALDNAARLAGLFHLAEQGPVGMIGQANLARGVKLATWHLLEARRVLNGLAPPQEIRDAEKLEEWALERAEAGQRAGTREAQQLSEVRDRGRLDAACALLEARSRARVVRRGKQKLIELNPRLIEVSE